MVIVVVPTLGPAFGGWVTDYYSWQWIFLAKSPLGLVAAALIWRFLGTRRPKKGRRDWTGREPGF